MAALHPNLRKKLEKAVVKARDVAEKAANSALQSLAVDSHQPFEHMSPELRQLRVKLRARGRAIGDTLDAKGKQGLWHLVREAAYEYWHRMLFARFLAENNLLMHPDGVAVTLDECEELASEEGLDKWELASRYAATMLPAIFRPDDPVLQVEFAPEDKLELEKLLTDLEPDVFGADDSLGWVYQFWQAKRKDEVNASEAKIGADELPAVTQLFTEDYMVKFLLHNSLGAWWAGKFLAATPQLAQNKDLTEEDLRKAVAFDDYAFEYLRFIFDEDNNTWKPAAGAFDGWPKEAKDITVLDPCCGSGHFLVAVFELMVRIRMAEENLSAKDAVDGVLKDNIFGLEIDARCTQIAAFALAFTAWKFPGAEGFRLLPQLNIACSGIPVTAKKEDWLKLANGNEKLKNGMDRLWTLFRQAPVLGSLIDPTLGDKHELIEASFNDLQPLLEKALESEKTKTDFELAETAVAAKGITQAATLLSNKYTLVITNVPYLARGKQGVILFDFGERFYPDTKWELATMFLNRFFAFASKVGTFCVVSPQNWLFSARFKSFRSSLLKKTQIDILGRLGAGAFETITGEVVKVSVGCFTLNADSKDKRAILINADDCKSVAEKAEGLTNHDFVISSSKQQLNNPDSRILFADGAFLSGIPLESFSECYQGLVTGDVGRFIHLFWEIRGPNEKWVRFMTAPCMGERFEARSSILKWENGKGELSLYAKETRHRLHDMHESGQKNWGKLGVAIGRITRKVSIYTGEHYDNSVAAVVPNDPSLVMPLYCYMNSREFAKKLQVLDQKLSLTNNTILKVDFDNKRWSQIAHNDYPSGLPEKYSDDPTQWIFKGTIKDTTEPLQVAAARLLGYRWPEQAKEPSIEKLADEDGIVCIPAVRGEQPASDRLRSVLATAFGDQWSPAKETELLSAVDGKKGMDDWLRNKFFIQHCKLFHNRPFIWHIWDGERDGFAALVNYHMLDHKLLETLTYAYLGDWINKQKADFEAGSGPAETKMLAALILQKKLELILRGENPYDIFIRWKPIHEQSIGWEPDLNDGVRMNIRPFFEADILRKKPNIKWAKDRGKEPARERYQYPWFWNDSEFVGDRVNDIHLSLKEKQQAREKAAKEEAGK